MITLGLDPSLTGFGWLIHDSSVTGPKRVMARGRWRTTSKTLWIERYVTLRGEVQRLLDSYLLIEAVGVESTTFGEKRSESLYALFLSVNEAVWSRRKDVVYFDPGTVKMLTKEDPSVRRGKMFKSDMIDAAKADTGLGRWTSDEADAYHIARFTARFWKFLRGEIQVTDLTPAEYQAFAKIHTFTRGTRAGETEMRGAIYKENQRFYRFSLLPA